MGLGQALEPVTHPMYDALWVCWRLLTLETRVGVVQREKAPGKPTTRRYSCEEKAAGVRMVGTLGAESGVTQGTVQRVASQLGYGVESVRMWVRQADIDDGVTPGVGTAEAQRVRQLEQENRELRRANEILTRAASVFGADSTASIGGSRVHRRDQEDVVDGRRLGVELVCRLLQVALATGWVGSAQSLVDI